MASDPPVMNRIQTTQNEPLQLQRLGAQRQLYGQAKLVLAAQIVLGFPVAILWIFVAWQCEHLRFAAATFGIVALFFDLYCLTIWQSALREKAAKIQEAFDCDVLELPWQKQKAGKRVDHEVEVDYSIRYQKVAAQHHPVTDWYPVAVSTIPLSVARVVCQRANCWWDSAQRRLYVKILLGVLFGVVATTTVAAMAADLSLQDYALVVGLPLLPFFRVVLIQIRDHRDAATRLDKLKDDAKELFDDARADPASENLKGRARALQDEIFESRKRNPPLFDWIFNRLRTAYEVQMNFSAAELAAQIHASTPERIQRRAGD